MRRNLHAYSFVYTLICLSHKPYSKKQ